MMTEFGDMEENKLNLNLEERDQFDEKLDEDSELSQKVMDSIAKISALVDYSENGHVLPEKAGFDKVPEEQCGVVVVVEMPKFSPSDSETEEGEISADEIVEISAGEDHDDLIPETNVVYEGLPGIHMHNGMIKTAEVHSNGNMVKNESKVNKKRKSRQGKKARKKAKTEKAAFTKGHGQVKKFPNFKATKSNSIEKQSKQGKNEGAVSRKPKDDAGISCQLEAQKRVLDEGPEEGEVLPEKISEVVKGALSLLVEQQVGLWSTDCGDDKDADLQDNKKTKRIISAQRKEKKKVIKKIKRAEKRRQQGIVRPKLGKLRDQPPIVCKYYLKGRCTKGDDCTFSHAATPETKSEICKFFLTNCCLKGDDCPYSHDLSLFPCKYFNTKGFCNEGDLCRFSHKPITEEEYDKLMQRLDPERRGQGQQGTEVQQKDNPSPAASIIGKDQLSMAGTGYGIPNHNTTLTPRDGFQTMANISPRNVDEKKDTANLISGKGSVMSAALEDQKVDNKEASKEQASSVISNEGGQNHQVKEKRNLLLLAAKRAASLAACSPSSGEPKLQSNHDTPKKYGQASVMELLQASLGIDNSGAI